MSTTTTPTAASVGELRLALDDIVVRGNVRELDLEHVDNLAQSIALRGVLVPLIVRATDDGWELVAGNHRIAACRQLGVEDVPVVVRDREGSSADRAAENVTRKQLTPLEEARAVQAMLDEGYTPDGVAQALGWSRQLVTARAKILRLPVVGQQLVGSGEIPVSAIDTVLAIGAVSPAIAGELCEAIAAQKLGGSQLVGSPGWAIGQVLRDSGVFGAYLNQVHQGDLKALQLGKKTDALVVSAEQLHKQVDRHAYGSPAIRFSEADVDQARAAGVLLELERSTPIICDRPLYRELCKQAIARTTKDLAYVAVVGEVVDQRLPQEALARFVPIVRASRQDVQIGGARASERRSWSRSSVRSHHSSHPNTLTIAHSQTKAMSTGIPPC